MINLLPPQYKNELKQERKYKLVLILGIVVLFFLISLSLILLSIKFYTQGQVESEKILLSLKEKQFKTPETEALQKDIVLVNQEISKLSSFYQNQTNLVEILEKLSQIFPPGMYLTSLSYQKAIFQISLSGYAPTRETLVQFKENLEKEFKEVNFPPSNWVVPTDINFQTTFKIK